MATFIGLLCIFVILAKVPCMSVEEVKDYIFYEYY
jgi:hypothetical protein